MSDREVLKNYLIEEFYDDFREGSISRRTFVRRVAFITGSMAAAVPVLAAVGCTPDELPSATDPIPDAEPTAMAAVATATVAATAAPTSVPPSAPKSPLSVAADDPAVSAAAATFDSGGTMINGYLARPSDAAGASGPYPGVLVCHENRGLTAHIEDVTRRFAKAGYVALAIDLLSREGGTAGADRDQVPAMLTDAGPERHVADFLAGAAFLKTQPDVDAARLAMTGYCFGGGITWRVATKMPDLKAAAPYYGAAPDAAEVPNIKAAVLGVYAAMDERINSGLPALEAALQAAGTTHEIKIYPDVNHAFHNDTGERYVEMQATQAWNDTLTWFATHM